MLVSYVLRLRTAQLRQGTFAGEILAVASGRRYRIASLEQMAAFITRSFAHEEERARHPTLDELDQPPPC
jgi:hypothetical protein